MKKCGYRNCENEITDSKIYCCRGHKENEKKYRNREKNPKPKGRPKSIWKRITDLSELDIKRLSEINELRKKISSKESI